MPDGPPLPVRAGERIPMITLHLEADLSTTEEERSLLQAVRTWEQAHPHVQMAIKVVAPDQRVREASAILNEMDPPFPFRMIIPHG